MRLAVHLTPSKGLPKIGLRESLQDIAASGYRNVEVTGIVDDSASSFRQELDLAGLNVIAYEVELHDLSGRPLLGGLRTEAGLHLAAHALERGRRDHSLGRAADTDQYVDRGARPRAGDRAVDVAVGDHP